jgi:hypothetical protein
MGEIFFLLVLAALLWLGLNMGGAGGGGGGIFGPSEAEQKVFRALGKKGRPTLVVFGAPT